MPAARTPRQPPEGEPSAGEHRRTRHRAGTRALLDIAHRLRPRDHTIAALLDQHTTLTTAQLSAVLFTSDITCRHRLQLLRRLGFIDRFVRHHGQPEATVCWVPGALSARYVALSRGENPPTARALRDRQDRVCASPTLSHLLAVNQFFTDLLAHARHQSGAALSRWWSERHTAAAFGQRIHPDGHGVWTEGGHQTGFFLELDRGTEAIGRLVDKLPAHRRLHTAGGPRYPLLFVLPGHAREQHLHQRLAGSAVDVPVATACAQPGWDPTGPVWLVAGADGRRRRLAELPCSPGRPGPLNPGPATPDDDPLRSVAR